MERRTHPVVTTSRPLFLVLGDQLFPPELLPLPSIAAVFMCEDYELCTRVRHHQQKLVLFLAAMRAYRDDLSSRHAAVSYFELDESAEAFEDRLLATLAAGRHDSLWHFEVDDAFMEQRLANFTARHGVTRRVLPSPKFLCDRATLDAYFSRNKTPHLADFYRRERLRHNVLIGADRQPLGGRWSFDADNRQKLPRAVTPPAPSAVRVTPHVEAVRQLVAARFAHHPGHAADSWLPTTRAQALAWLDEFLAERLRDFGAYEDAITTRSPTVFHSVLTPVLNLGLLTPREVLDAALERADRYGVPLNSLEGFVRQLMGWREFVHGIYRQYGERQASANFFAASRTLTPHWYDGTTGIPPLDDTIRGARQRGWSHHIERLMIVGNLMTLCEISPPAAYRWFMEMYVDSADWVMGPNVFGMGLFSDGGVFATKPYICGSNYLLKMSDYARGPWCDVVDGLYWRFIELHLDFFSRQPRLSVIAGGLARLTPERRHRIGAAATQFLERCTVRDESGNATSRTDCARQDL